MAVQIQALQLIQEPPAKRPKTGLGILASPEVLDVAAGLGLLITEFPDGSLGSLQASK